jgi:hypothetical protein
LEDEHFAAGEGVLADEDGEFLLFAEELIEAVEEFRFEPADILMSIDFASMSSSVPSRKYRFAGII